ncbi:hypothetical protein HGO38_24080 [Rhizobium sp. CG5]|uniref:hypothetical protein n=1 Tax=Rhizobium sp. CG5 TaxID=2726076 RepID=UPI00203488DA|nr:hypothetical protein [Rhizobium sp. CG5]MCM2476529.1 hypothetical protein [Rhizobium sp. CG5]
MGREALGNGRWKGQSGTVKALLESDCLILHGAVRARFPRSTLSDIRAHGDTLSMMAGGEPLELDLGHAEAVKWASVLQKPLPTLSHKLGVGPDTPAHVLGPLDDAALCEALAGAVVPSAGEAAMLIAVLREEADLGEALLVSQTHGGLPIWCVYGKGPFKTVSDSLIRSFLRASGYIDSKTSAVSDRLTATRYAPAGKRAKPQRSIDTKAK